MTTETANQPTVDILAVEALMADGKLRTRDEIEQELGRDPEEALEALFNAGKLSISRAAGIGFYEKHEPGCSMGLHSWINEVGKLSPTTRCVDCGELYGHPD